MTVPPERLAHDENPSPGPGMLIESVLTVHRLGHLASVRRAGHHLVPVSPKRELRRPSNVKTCESRKRDSNP